MNVMKYSLIKNAFGLLALISFPVLFAGCEQDAKFKAYVYPTAEVSEMYPKLGSCFWRSSGEQYFIL